jgi:hypothetical protein
MEVVGFLGNSVGALAVETVGHRGIVSQADLCRLVTSLVGETAREGEARP